MSILDPSVYFLIVGVTALLIILSRFLEDRKKVQHPVAEKPVVKRNPHFAKYFFTGIVVGPLYGWFIVRSGFMSVSVPNGTIQTSALDGTILTLPQYKYLYIPLPVGIASGILIGVTLALAVCQKRETFAGVRFCVGVCFIVSMVLMHVPVIMLGYEIGFANLIVAESGGAILDGVAFGIASIPLVALIGAIASAAIGRLLQKEH